ncbi:ABC1 kinase family protein [Falsibacillus albus]|uniref:AarF/ABC1/UbiB kinase family protein n=1 Tax=Falsibacillus albus TaxID=2478915 RepID=A0A3L7JU37_9BACI|nr:AarF/UbiB family protein [Falsibacillus albus]RLQ93794.1 AarF/ABC1/UbiB kinase family protein [Falsibacillus albus]
MKTERKMWRMWKVLSLALSIVLRVYWHRITKKSEADKEALWERIGQQFRQTLFELEGVLIKVGQMLSIRADLLPNGFIKQIQDMVDQVPPSPWEKIQKVLEDEWDRPLNNVLHSIETKAIASASIGEVYQGILRDGTKVAIKVQRPNIKSLVRTDFRSLAIIIWFADRFAPVPKGFINFNMLYKELKHVIERELDFNKEMETAIHFHQRFQEFNGAKVPGVYPEHCTSKVMVMEWVEGFRATDTKALERCNINRNELSERLLRLFLPQWLEAGIFHADPHSGNVLIQEDGTIILLDFGMVGEISRKDASHFQSFLEAVLMKNYEKAAGALGQLGFLLPEADPKSIESVLAEALSFDLEKMKEMDILTAKKEINDMVKDLPIQVPTRFVFLGRSFVTIEGMIHIITPDKETLEIVKPAFMDWLKHSNTSKWQLFLKWMNAQPFFQIVHSVQDYLEAPKRHLELQEKQQYEQFEFSMLENRKTHAFFFSLLGIIGTFSGIYFDRTILWEGASLLSALAFIGYFMTNRKQRKWLKRVKMKR